MAAMHMVDSVRVLAGGFGGWHPGILKVLLLSISVQRIGIFCWQSAEKLEKEKKKIFGPLAVTFGTTM